MAELLWQGKKKPGYDRSSEAIDDSDGKSRISKVLVTTEIIGPQPGEQQAGGAPSLSPVWHNRLILGDKSQTLSALLPEFAGKVNLIYIDPPFMTGRDFKSGEQLAYSDKWDNNLDAYLQWLYETFVLLHRLLARTGSLYVPLDWRVTHYARLLLDEVFGSSASADGAGFKNEIIWHYQSGGRTRRRYARKHDTILF